MTAEKIEDIPSDQRNHLKHKILVCSESCSNLEKLGWVNYQELISRKSNPKCPENLVTSSTDIMQIFFTSGTTGKI